MNDKVNIGIAGAQFGSGFQFHLHPFSKVAAVADLTPSGRGHLQNTYCCSTVYNSFEDLIKDPIIDAVFIATPAPLHAQHIIAALKMGKHVLSAVPIALNLQDCHDILETVLETGLIFMLAETSFYRQSTISARSLYEGGRFGEIFNVDAEYSHPGLEEYFFNKKRKTWRHGLPPMLYPSHCISFLTGVTKERLVSVSCLGWGDGSPLLNDNVYNNRFWNQRALFRTERDNFLSVSINWRGALRNIERANWFGEHLSYICDETSEDFVYVVQQKQKAGKDDGGFKIYKNSIHRRKQKIWWKTTMLPKALRINSGHGGSHCFITHEFVDAVKNDRPPAIDIYQALACTVPGLIAHESSLRDGETLKIPLFY